MSVRVAESTPSESTPFESIPSVAVSVPAVPAFATILFGVFLLFVVGFAQAPKVHNGAHDTRHANGFPCH